jgi:hypothetical protein
MPIPLTSNNEADLRNLVRSHQSGKAPGAFATVRLILSILRDQLGWRALYLCPRALLTSRRARQTGEPDWMASAVRKFLFLRALYQTTRQTLGQERAERLAQELLLKLGIFEWLKVLPIAEARRLGPEDFLRLFHDSVKPAMGAHSVDTYEAHGNEMIMTVHQCMLVEIFTALGMPELLPYLCQTDRVYLDALAPEITFSRNEVIAEGAPQCRFVFSFGSRPEQRAESARSTDQIASARNDHDGKTPVEGRWERPA